MGVLGCGHDDGIEVVRLVEHAPEVGEPRRTREPLRRGVQRLLVHVAQDGHVLVGMRGRWPGFAAPVLRRASGLAVAPGDELADAVEGPAAAGDERDVQLVVQIAARSKAGAPVSTPAAVKAPPTNSRRVTCRVWSSARSWLLLARALSAGLSRECNCRTGARILKDSRAGGKYRMQGSYGEPLDATPSTLNRNPHIRSLPGYPQRVMLRPQEAVR